MPKQASTYQTNLLQQQSHYLGSSLAGSEVQKPNGQGILISRP
jgi:hypothetical protein